MTDDFDDAIRSRFHQLEPTSSVDAHAVLDELRPAMRRARIKRSLAVGTATLSVVGLVGLGAVAVTNSITDDQTELDILIDGDPLPNVTPAPSTTQQERDDAEPVDTIAATTSSTTPPTTPAPTTATPEPTAPTTVEPQSTPQPPAPTTPNQPTPSPPATGTDTTAPATTNPPNATTPATTTPATVPNLPETSAPPTSAPASSTTSSTAPATTVAPVSGQQTIQSNCGSITVSWIGDSISLIAIQPVAGFSPETEDAGPDRVRVSFDNGDAECEIDAEIESGALVADVKNDDD